MLKELLVKKSLELTLSYITKSIRDEFSTDNRIDQNSLKIAKGYFNISGTTITEKNIEIVRSGLQHLETAYAAFIDSNYQKNDLVEIIIQWHSILGDDYQVIRYWLDKVVIDLFSVWEPHETLKDYIRETDYIDLRRRYKKAREDKRELDRRCQDAIDDFNAFEMTYPGFL